MRKLLTLAFVLVFSAGCARNPFVRGRNFNSSALEWSLQITAEQCKEVAERVDLISTLPGTLLADERPDYGFSNQVLSPDELVEGGIYVWCSMLDGQALVIGLNSGPYEVEGSKGTVTLWVDGIFLEDFDDGNTYSWSLWSMGIVPDEKGRWNEVSVLLYPL
jgi:hypothetical protein